MHCSAAGAAHNVLRMRRVAVVGCGGAGKTTLANELGRRLGLPVVHIDSHYWQLLDGQRIESTAEQWQRRHRELVAHDEWVIDGMKLGVLDERLARADTVIFLDPPTISCLSGILRRRLRYRGHDNPSSGIYVSLTWEFVRWVCTFRARQRPKLLAKLASFDGETIILRQRRDIDQFLMQIVR